MFLPLLLTLFAASGCHGFVVAKCNAPTAVLCGEQLGRQAGPLIKQALEEDGLKSFLAWSTSTPAARNLTNEFVAANTAAFPALIAELRAVALGAGVAPDTLVIANLATEIGCVAGLTGPGRIRAKSCTDMHMVGRAAAGTPISAWGHNEDEEPLSSFTYLVEANITGDGTDANPPFAYTGFAYAPAMVGWAWGFNSHGHGQSVNVLFPNKCVRGLGMNFVARHVLEATSLDDAIARANVGGAPHAEGQNFNVGNIAQKGSGHVMIETSPDGVKHRFVTNSTAHHCNSFEIWPTDEGGVHPSTAHRLARIAVLEPAIDSVAAILGVLSDRTDPLYPIFRSGKPPDCCQTLSTALFDVVAERVTMWLSYPEAPNTAPPYMSWDWRTMTMLPPPESRGRSDE